MTRRALSDCETAERMGCVGSQSFHLGVPKSLRFLCSPHVKR